MEKPSEGSSRELQCVGKLEIVRPKPAGVFLCGSIPVPTDKAFHAFNSALVPSRQKVIAPRYRMLPMETDLNTPPLLSNFPEQVLPIWAVQSITAGDLPWDGGAVTSNLTRKCEALAVSGLVDYGDEIDVIAPADILKQIFKMPYSKARLSIAVHRVGKTLVLNAGPDVEEGEKLVRRHGNQAKSVDHSLFLNFAMHSVRMEACDCPPTYHTPAQEKTRSSVLPGGNASQFASPTDKAAQGGGFNYCSEYSKAKQDAYLWDGKKSKRSNRHDSIKKASEVGEKPRSLMQETEKHRRTGDDGFLRVLFWQFHNFRMLLGSDLLLFSNEKYVSVSLHLWDITRQVAPLTWLEAWLDNVMASVPELAICYHQNGVVQGYELLKTDDIFLLKGISEDGTPAFHPYVVQQNGLSVLRFLQENCKQDPGAYWLYKSAGEDVIQLFDLSVIPKNHSPSDCDDSSNSLPSLLYRGKSDASFSLGTLLYRIAHRLSLSMTPTNKTKCVRFFKQCLDFLNEPVNLVVRASAHEQFARLILNFEDELDFTLDSLPVGCEVTVTDAEEESLDFLTGISDPNACDDASSLVAEDKPGEDDQGHHDLLSEASVTIKPARNVPPLRELITSGDKDLRDPGGVANSSADENFAVCKVSPTPLHVQTVADPISSKLTAIHHVSQAIKSLRWMRQLQSSETGLGDQVCESPDSPSSINFSVCACGDADCIEICDLRAWLPKSKLDHKLWKLVLLLGESYLALGQAYKEDGQLHQSLKVVELACSVYGSMPQHLDDTRFISSMISYSLSQIRLNDRDTKINSHVYNLKEVNSGSDDAFSILERYSSTYLFWAKAWTLVGDIYVEFHILNGKEISRQTERKTTSRELRMSSEVVKEVNRLKKKLGKFKQNCSSCSLVNCSCQSDRANSGSSASSSRRETTSYNRKHSKRCHSKSLMNSHIEESEDDDVCQTIEKGSQAGDVQQKSDGQLCMEARSATFTATSEKAEDTLEMHGMGSVMASELKIPSKETPKLKSGGIFRYLGGPVIGGAECKLLAALSCYEEARKALGEVSVSSMELQSVMRKKGWVCNELGRLRLERKELHEAEAAFADAIDAFREVYDHANIILISCNLGHGRRALAEEMVQKIEDLKRHRIFQSAYYQALETAKLEYSESLRYYGAAKSELDAAAQDSSGVLSSLRNEVYTQLGHTYLRLGMLLAREDTTAEVYNNEVLEDACAVYVSPSVRATRKESRKHDISANDAIREALTIYESLGGLRKQETAYAYFQLACYQKDCCLKFLESDYKNNNLSKVDDGLQRVKRYASLAERNWQKALEFYGSDTHPIMYLTVLLERSALSFSLSSSLNSNAMLEAAFSLMLEVRNISETNSDFLKTEHPEMHTKFCSQLQMVLKKMVSVSLTAGTNKSFPVSQPSTVSNRFGEVEKLKELYKISLKSSDFIQLHNMHTLWTS